MYSGAGYHQNGVLKVLTNVKDFARFEIISLRIAILAHTSVHPDCHSSSDDEQSDMNSADSLSEIPSDELSAPAIVALLNARVAALT